MSATVSHKPFYPTKQGAYRPVCPEYQPGQPGFPKISFEPTESHEERMKQLHVQTLGISTSALEHYNKKHHADYELVEALLSSPLVCGDGIWFHCNYKAKDRAVSGEGSDGSPIKLFFSEVKLVSMGYVVTACRILDGVKQITGCDYCPKVVIHPAAGFRKGLYRRDMDRVSSLRSCKRARNI